MSDRIMAVSGVGDAAGSRAIDLFRHAAYSVPRQARQVRPEGLRAGAPADVVELSLDADTVRQLPANLHLKFLVNPDDSQIVIQVIDSTTDTVVRTVPSEKLRDALRHLS
jgi:hypothetical protein